MCDNAIFVPSASDEQLEGPDQVSSLDPGSSLTGRRVSLPPMRLSAILEQDEKNRIFFKRRKSIQIDPETKRIIFEKERTVPKGRRRSNSDSETETETESEEEPEKGSSSVTASNGQAKSSTCTVL
ncbi:hypothetical protein HDE_00402 [Halotydeus destructor]|nr:hypothetical protein HDE_00402 [Halotydeus destructor]